MRELSICEVGVVSGGIDSGYTRSRISKSYTAKASDGVIATIVNAVSGSFNNLVNNISGSYGTTNNSTKAQAVCASGSSATSSVTSGGYSSSFSCTPSVTFSSGFTGNTGYNGSGSGGNYY